MSIDGVFGTQTWGGRMEGAPLEFRLILKHNQSTYCDLEIQFDLICSFIYKPYFTRRCIAANLNTASPSVFECVRVPCWSWVHQRRRGLCSKEESGQAGACYFSIESCRNLLTYLMRSALKRRKRKEEENPVVDKIGKPNRWRNTRKVMREGYYYYQQNY